LREKGEKPSKPSHQLLLLLLWVSRATNINLNFKKDRNNERRQQQEVEQGRTNFGQIDKQTNFGQIDK
jgi:hypothetical protein